MSALRVLFVSHSAEMMGAERSLAAALAELDRTRCEPIVLLPRAGPLKDALAGMGIQVVSCRLPWWLARRNGPIVLSFRAVQALVIHRYLGRLLRRLRVDVVYTNSLVVPSAALAAHRAGIPHIWHLRELPAHNETLRGPFSLKNIYARVNAWSTVVACNGEAVAEHVRTYGLQPVIIPNPIDLPPQSGTPAELRGRAPRILVLGTLSPAKGQHLAVEALAQLDGFPEATLHLVGTGPTGYERLLRGLSRDLCVEDRVYFYGYQSNPWPFYAAADLVVVPSLQEAFGRTAAEAAILKRPVIGADAGGLQEILPASQRFESGNSAALASALTLALTAAEPVGSVDADALRARHAPVAIAELMMDLIEGAVRA